MRRGGSGIVFHKERKRPWKNKSEEWAGVNPPSIPPLQLSKGQNKGGEKNDSHGRGPFNRGQPTKTKSPSTFTLSKSDYIKGVITAIGNRRRQLDPSKRARFCWGGAT